jgi:hypothetical protein
MSDIRTIHSISLYQEENDILDHLTREQSALTGRPDARSEIIRLALRKFYADYINSD